MRTAPTKAAAIVLVAFLAALLAAVPAQAREVRDAFLWERVESVDAFIAQIEANPVIAQRFAKHYHVSQAELVKYLRENLTVVQVPETRTYTIYGVNKIGRIYPVKGVLKKGWKAFGLRDGTLLFKWSCGNPLTTSLPPVPKPKPKPVVTPLPPPQPTVALPQDPLVIALADPMLPGFIPDAQALVSDTPELMPVEEQPPVPVTVAKALPLLPLLGLMGVSGHGEPSYDVIPEPSAIALWAVGLGVFAGCIVWRRRRDARLPLAAARGRTQ